MISLNSNFKLLGDLRMKQLKAVIIAGMGCGTFIVTFAIAKDMPIKLKLTIASETTMFKKLALRYFLCIFG
jgi:hypothetical protein